MTDFDLSAFLADQRAGGTSEGEGEFTISHEKAAQKMSQYSLPREHAWALKLVQSAIGWRCSGIKLTQSRTHSTFTFYTQEPERLPSNQEIISAILRADPESDHPTSGFSAALRILVEKAHLSFLLRVDRGEEAPQAIYAGVHFSDMGERNRAKHRAQWDGNVNLRIHHIPHTDPNRLLLNYVPVRHHALPILWELQEYAYVSPIPITVDGRRIDGVLPGRYHQWKSGKRPIRLSSFNIPGTTYPTFEICDGFADQVLSLYAPLDTAAEAGRQSSISQVYWIMSIDSLNLRTGTIPKSRGGTLYWVRNGVVVDRAKLDLSTRCLDVELYASAQGMSTDLTGFQLRRDNPYTAKRTRILEHMMALVEQEHNARRDIFFKAVAATEKEVTPPQPSQIPSGSRPALFPQPPRGALAAVELLAKTFSSITQDLLKEFNGDFEWNEDLMRGHYLKDLQDLIARKMGESPRSGSEPPEIVEASNQESPPIFKSSTPAPPKRYHLPKSTESFQWTPSDKENRDS